MLNKIIHFFLENKLVTVLILILFITWRIITSPFGWDTGLLPSDSVPVDTIPDIGENQQIVRLLLAGIQPALNPDAVYTSQNNGLRAECISYIKIRGSSNINQFELISNDPEVANTINTESPYRLVQILVDSFNGSNKRMLKDFREMVNASEYPYINIEIERREFSACVGKKGLTDFRTKITIADNSNIYEVPCAVDTCEISGYVIEGGVEVKLTDFEIDPPKKFFGLIKVKNEVLIRYAFWFQPGNI